MKLHLRLISLIFTPLFVLLATHDIGASWHTSGMIMVVVMAFYYRLDDISGDVYVMKEAMRFKDEE